MHRSIYFLSRMGTCQVTWSSKGPKNNGVGERIRSIDLLVDDLYVLGQHFSKHRIQVDRGAEEWFVELDGDEAIGSIVVPYDFSGDKPLLVKMEKLNLPSMVGHQK